VCRRLRCEVDLSKTFFETRFRINNFPYSDGNEFEGIFSHLRRRCNGNIHQKDIVFVSSSSSSPSNNKKSGCWSVINHISGGWGDDTLWESEDLEESWICFDFKAMRVGLTAYTVKSHGNGHLVDWILEGSNDGRNWRRLDRRNVKSVMFSENELRQARVYGCGNGNEELFRFVRVRQKGENSRGSNALCLCGVELFGRLEMLSSKGVERGFWK
jgi:hypothetical protein